MPPFTAGRRAGSVPSRPLLASLTGATFRTVPRALPRSFARALCAATLCSLAPVAIAAGLPADLGERLARDYARPAMARMAQASEQMDAALGAWCARPDAAGATRVNDAHRAGPGLVRHRVPALRSAGPGQPL